MEEKYELETQLRSPSEKNQLQVIPKLVATGETGLEALMEWMDSRRDRQPNLALAKAYQALYRADTPKTREFLQTRFPDGIITPNSQRDVDYQSVQELLAKQDFKSADTLTRQKLCELAGTAAQQRGWLYFSEVDNFPASDLETINRLWLLYSEGKFGFSVQRKIWLSVGKDFDRLWQRIGWKTSGNWTRYPQEFTWDLSAPEGHLPLSNQLRGVRVIASIFSHPVWTQTSV
ncbi:GUN4 domain-containing protein [Myxosarcina sp. GI1]|uniref:GUN4 domain-containing protein n=1 Tax=Myxosarcina sp. GI1 TaxID=1541065 RepID=UPI00055B337D|nr:GUN4 domain-containing protein [Myxosarcina sp. GI1]